MKRYFRRLLTLLLTVCLLFCAVPAVLPALAATTTVYDFNGSDFDTQLLTSNVGSGVALATEGVPAGSTGAVMSGTHSTYVSVGVDFEKPINTAKITSIKVRMYVASYTTSGTPQLRILSTAESTSQAGWLGQAYVAGWGGAFDQWCEIDITDVVKNTVTKDADGYLDRFVIAYRVYGTNATVYYDSILIEGEDYFVQESEPTETVITPTTLVNSNTAGGDWRFWLTVEGTLPTGLYYGLDQVPYTIRNKNDEVVANGISATFYRDGSYLMPFVSGNYTANNQPSEGDYVTLSAGTYAQSDDVDTSIMFEKDIILSYLDGIWVLGHPDISVFDFNDTDFATAINGNGSVGSTEATAKLTDTASVPAGFSGSVHAGGGATYAAVAVDFPLPMDTSVVSKVTVRMYVPSYTLSGTPKLRILSTDEKTGSTAKEYGFEAAGGVYGQWVEMDITDAVKNVVTKDADGYLDRFVIAYRVYGAETPVVYYDSIHVTYEGTLFIEDKFEVPADGVFDFNGKDFDTPTTTNAPISSTDYIASAPMSSTASVPTGFTDGVYSASNIIYDAVWVDFHGVIDLDKITSIKVRMYISSYTLESGKTPSFRIFGTSDTYEQKLHDGTYDQWFELELLDLLKGSKVSKNADGTVEKFMIAYRAYATEKPTVYFDSILIEGEDYFTIIDKSSYVNTAISNLMENISGPSGSLDRWDAYLSTSDNTALPGTAWSTSFPVKIKINSKETTATLYNAGADYGFFLDIWYTQLPKDTAYAKVVLKAGEYTAGDGSGIILTEDFTYYVYNGDLWNSLPPADFAVDVTLNTMSVASKVNGGQWDMYPTPVNSADTPGVPWSSSWANVAYEIDGVAYTGTMKRANNSEGLHLAIPGTQLSPAADGVTVVIKAGNYASNTDDTPAIRITEDFTFYVIKGVVTTEFDFNDPAFTATVTVDIDNDTYTVTDADTVIIDGEIYNRGDVYDIIGTHTLTYTMYEREYTRQLILYRVGEVGDTEQVDVHDVVLLKRYLAGAVELSESALLGADMNGDGSVTAADLTLLRKMELMMNGLLILCPQSGITAMKPSAQVAELETDYDLTANATNNMKNGTQQFHRDALFIKWVSAENVSEYQLSVATKSDFSDAMVHTTDKTEYTLYNLLPATTYYWKVAAGTVESEVRSFVTADTVRTLTIEGVDNARDIGGFTLADGSMLNYGMVYRTGTLDNITEDGLYQMLTVLGVKTDLDIRTPGEGTAGSGSPLGDSVNYLNYNGPYYWNSNTGLLAESYRDALIGEIRAFADADNYPIVVHCSVGRDRTGTILFLIEGLCGMSKEDLFFEYELSFLAAVGGDANAQVTYLMNAVSDMYDGIQGYAPDATFAEACEAFILSLGVTQEEIDTIRELLTENVL
ncbi:MAG: tyrosine-protein phosphatase [Clostridia bacterium]|nr:tyrosine-protein phosphatase [Clostridia bacterium]